MPTCRSESVSIFAVRQRFRIPAEPVKHGIAVSRESTRLVGALAKTTDRPAGYWDYEGGRPWTFSPAMQQRAVADLQPAPAANPSFPALDHLDTALSDLPPETHVVFVMPRGSTPTCRKQARPWRIDLAGCKHALMQRASARPNWFFLDFLLDTPIARTRRISWIRLTIVQRRAAH